MHWEGCLASITLRKESDDQEAPSGDRDPPGEFGSPKDPYLSCLPILLHYFKPCCFDPLTPELYGTEQGNSPATPGKVNQSLLER